MCSIVITITGTNITTKSEFNDLVNRTLTNNHWEVYYNKYQNYFYHIGLDNAKQLGHRFKHLVTKCLVGTKHYFRYYWHPCLDYGEVQYFPSPEFFNCYVLDFYNQTHAFPVGRIELVLFMDNFDREQHTHSGSNRVHIVFHKRNTFDFGNMFSLIPGQKTNMDVSYSFVEQLPKPYGVCVEEPDKNYIWTLNGRKLEYSKAGCQFAIYQRLKNYCCGCINENYPIIDFQLYSTDNVTSCRKISENGVFNYSCKDDEKCFNAWDRFETECPDICEFVSYHVSVSSFTWPNQRDIYSFYKEYIAGKDFEFRFKRVFQSPQLLYRMVKENFAKVTINLDVEEIVTYRDSPKFTFTSFISALGGLLNLYSGISFIIIIEIIDLCLSISCRCFKSNTLHSKVTEIKQQNI